MKYLIKSFTFFCASMLVQLLGAAQSSNIQFNDNWKFQLALDSTGAFPSNNNWKTLQLPHDWSIEGNFSASHKTTFNQAALPAGIGRYQKDFIRTKEMINKEVFIYFDGVFCNSEVWVNDHFVGKRPNGYVGFEYDITPYLQDKNTIKVKVDNFLQPNSRYYTGSGIYRDVQLIIKDEVYVKASNIFFTTPQVSKQKAVVQLDVQVSNPKKNLYQIKFDIVDPSGKIISSTTTKLGQESKQKVILPVASPQLWNTEHPNLYKAIVRTIVNGSVKDVVETKIGIRNFRFDVKNGFYLNDVPTKILGVCMHHDLGALGAAFNKSAAKRQLQLLKEMGCNAIRTAHNMPASAFLDLCDEMGFLVMDEAFDMWQKKKNKFDYSKDFAKWYQQDLEAMILRDRNHPSVFMWSIGNEIREQFDSSGIALTKNMVAIVKALDATRPVTSALTENILAKNFIAQAGALDLLGFNYKQYAYDSLPTRFVGKPLIAAETASALETRGVYLLPADSNYVWPSDSKDTKPGNVDYTCSAYDNTYAYWGTTHENSWLSVKNRPFVSGLFVWSGFDFLGEPVPYAYPARSSYYGIIDLAGIPKDVYYMYQSEWTKKPVLHVLPHWNWKKGDMVDVWAYYNNADLVSLYLNGKLIGTSQKTPQKLHAAWKLPFEPGVLKVVSTLKGKVVLSKEVFTAGAPAKLQLSVNSRIIHPNSENLCFITAKLLDAKGNLVPIHDQKIDFMVEEGGTIIATDNGSPVSHESFNNTAINTLNGVCIAIVKPSKGANKVKIKASSSNIPDSKIEIIVQ
jgi:beta-galactosidase